MSRIRGWVVVTMLFVVGMHAALASTSKKDDDEQKQAYGTLLLRMPKGVMDGVGAVHDLRMALRKDEMQQAARNRELDERKLKRYDEEMKKRLADLKSEIDKGLSSVRRDLDSLDKKRVRVKERADRASATSRDRLVEQLTAVEAEMEGPRSVERAFENLYSAVRGWGGGSSKADSLMATVGRPLPRIRATDAAGEEVDPHALANGKGVLLSFWTEHNIESEGAAKQLASMRKELDDAGFVVVLAYVGEDLATAQKVMGRAGEGISMVKVEPRAAREELGLGLLPATLMVLPDREVHSVFVSRSMALKNGIGGVLSELAAKAKLAGQAE